MDLQRFFLLKSVQFCFRDDEYGLLFSYDYRYANITTRMQSLRSGPTVTILLLLLPRHFNEWLVVFQRFLFLLLESVMYDENENSFQLFESY